MHSRLHHPAGRSTPGALLRLGRVLTFALPLGLLLVAGMRGQAADQVPFWAGVGVLSVAFAVAVAATRAGRESSSAVVILLHVVALGCLVTTTPDRPDWVGHLARSVLLVVPVLAFALQCLRDSGAPTMRRARQLAARIAARKDWPADLSACRSLPEVKALRECLHVDASPALALLANHRPAVRVAALAALEYRLSWRPGQAELVMQLAKRAVEPEVRAAAVNALANAEDRDQVEALGERLRDGSPLVRHAATEALLWNSDGRWHWLRDAVRLALNDPDCAEDGPLRLGGSNLAPEMLTDLNGWCAEKGLIALRAALTLGEYYGHLLAGGAPPELTEKLRGQLLAPSTPPMLRLELARLLTDHREVDAGPLRQLLASTMPAPVRLLAAERLLAAGASPEAESALHELARLPNRELALSTAEVVQRSLGVDLGLPRGGPPPAPTSPLAAEVARRLITWANQFGPALPGLASGSGSNGSYSSPGFGGRKSPRIPRADESRVQL